MKLRRQFALLITMVMLFCIPGNVYAAEYDEAGQPMETTGITFPTAEEMEEYYNNLSEEEKQLIAEKEAEAARIAEEWETNQRMTRAATKISIPGNFTIYGQENNYYCAPACVKSIIQYKKNSSPSQSTLANEMGTNPYFGTPMENISPCLRSHTSYLYVLNMNPSQTQMLNYLYSTIAENKMPCIMGISNSEGILWHYSTAGHALVVNAIYSDKSRVQFADPLGGQYGGKWYYEKSAEAAKLVCMGVIW